MTDEVKQLAHGRVEREFEEYNTLHETEIEKLLVSFGAEVQRQTAEGAASWLVARGEYLPRYLAEFEYRFNRRDEQEQMFGETVRRMVKTDKMPFRQLVLEAKRGRPNNAS